MKPLQPAGSANHPHSKMSLPELLLLALAFLCFLAAVYLLLKDSRSTALLFFVLHACSGALFYLVSLNRLSLEQTPERELSYDRNLQKQLLAEKTEENDRLRRQSGRYRKRADELEAELQKMQAANLELSDRLQEADRPDNTDTAFISQLLPACGEEHPVSLDLITSIRQVMEEMLPYTQKAGIQVQLSTSSESLTMNADPEYLRILLRNVIDNSVKYMQKAGRLIITVSGIGEDLFLVLKDNGNGLNADETNHIFELNYQGSNRVSGNGLGLTQAKAIVDHYGGTIYAKSGSGDGMAIYIQLPSGNLQK